MPNWELDEYKIWRKVNTRKMNSKLRKDLIEFFRPYNQQLYSLLGQNFDWENDA